MSFATRASFLLVFLLFFCIVFIACSSVSPLRMDKAKELLRCTSKRSSEIAGEVGYKDAHYFSYLFKKTQGMTPSEYRKTRGEV